jgi:hypothetical protein
LTNIDLQLKLLASPSHDALAQFDVPTRFSRRPNWKSSSLLCRRHRHSEPGSCNISPRIHRPAESRASRNPAKQFQAARDDFKAMGKLLPNQPYLAEYGLAEVAAAEKNKAEEIDHLKRCLRSAPEESSEYQRATNRLNALEGH